MPGRNNTTPVGDGSVGVNSEITSAAGRMIDQTVSENNLRASLDSGDPSYAGLLTAIQNMVARWLPSDKLRILQEYGNVQGMPKNASGAELDKYVAITLISRLPQSELKFLIKKQTNQAAGLKGAAAKAEGKAAMYAKKATAAMTKATANQMANASQNAGSAKAMLKNLNAGSNDRGKDRLNNKDSGFYIDKYSKEAISGLRKEVNVVLSAMPNKAIVNLLIALNISYDEGQSSVDSSKKKINNVVNFYAALILGKEKGLHGSAFSPKAIEEIEKILLMTSFGYITGRVGMNDGTIAIKRKALRDAKRKQDALSAQAQTRGKVNFGKIKEARKGKQKKNADKNKNIKAKYPHKNHKLYDEKLQQLAKMYSIKCTKKNDTDEDITADVENIADLDKITWGTIPKEQLEKLRSFALSNGIDDAETAPPKKLLMQLALILTNEQEDINESIYKASKIKDAAKRKEELSKIRERMKNSVTMGAEKIANKAERGTQDFSDKIPVVSYNVNGEITSTAVNMAVPVVLMGSAIKLSSEQTNDSFKFIKDEGSDLGVGKTNISEEESQKRKDTKTKEEIEAERAGLEKFQQNFSEEGKIKKKLFRKTGKVREAKRKNQIIDAAGNVMTNNAAIDQLFDGAAKKEENNTESSNTEESTPADSLAQALVGKLKYSDIDKLDDAGKKFNEAVLRTDSITPTFDLAFAKGFDIISTKLDYLKKIEDHTDNLATVFSAENVGLLQMSNQILGVAANTAAAGGAAVLANTGLAGATDSIVDNLSSYKDKYVKQATGGSMVGKSTSQVITGDPMRGSGNKANPELVSVDWSSQKIKVSPIPQLATGGKVQENNSNVSSVTRMTTGERNKPLGVGIQSGIVNYSKQLSDVSDDGTKTAVKVYSINSGINEKVNIGGAEVSLFDAVYGIYSAITTVASSVDNQSTILSAIAQTAANISKNTAKIASASTSSGGSGFQFPTELDMVLSGE